MNAVKQHKTQLVDCEWCGKTGVKGHLIKCNLKCFHYACTKCSIKNLEDLK